MCENLFSYVKPETVFSMCLCGFITFVFKMSFIKIKNISKVLFSNKNSI